MRFSGTKKALTFVSLYSGAGGLDLGFVRSGFVPEYAIDIDEDAAATYTQHFATAAERGESPHRCEMADITDRMSQMSSLSADLVIGGPPCQGFSVAGHQDRSDPRSKEVWNFLEAVQQIEPRAFVMENVKSLVCNTRWAGLLQHICRSASGLGYTVYVFVLNAADVGVPQKRERAFIIGMPRGMPFARPQPDGSDTPSVRESLRQLPKWGSPGNDSFCAAQVTLMKRPVLRRSPFAGYLFNGRGGPVDLDGAAPTLPAIMGGNVTPVIDQVHLDGQDECWVTRYHAHLMRGGQPYDSPPAGRLRRLTVEEAAHLQGFPIGMRWVGSKTSAFRQIGNAVPPPLGEAVARSVAAALMK